MMEFTVHGLDEMIAALEALPARIDDSMSEGIHQRADEVETRFIGCTPIDTSATAGDWRTEEHGLLEVAVVNRHTTVHGFLVASGLLTGTGSRGAGATPARGYSGGFTPAWPGMFPAAALQGAWNDGAARSLATPELLEALHA